MSEYLSKIIDSIEFKIQNELDPNVPVCIYVGIGTYAGMLKNVEGIQILDDKNYHQFPPVLQDMYKNIDNIHFFCIYIDPVLEDPIYITQDLSMKQKLFNNNNWIINNDKTYYYNNRINIYPFRHSIKVKNKMYDNKNDYLDITSHIERLNNLAINNNLLYLYHDFCGNNNIKYIEQYFIEKNDNNFSSHLDHIIYGFGNGYINECYYDFREPECFFGYYRSEIVNQNINRKLIKVFNIQQILNKYNSLDKQTQKNIPVIYYINNYISEFPEDKYHIILSQIKLYIKNFEYIFKNKILVLLRKIYDIQLKINNNINNDNESDFNYILDLIDEQSRKEIINMYDNSDNRIFKKTKEIIATKYKNEIDIISFYKKNNLTGIDVLNAITKDEDKYKWVDAFNMLIS